MLLVTPPEYDYSGMISGVVAGQYRPEQARFDPDRLARAAGAEWIPGRVRRIDAPERRVILEDGSGLEYDLLSLDVGSRPAGLGLPGVRRHAIPVKPVRHGLRFLSAAARAAGDASPGEPARLVIVGGGAAGVEIALCLDAALARRWRPDRYRISLLERGPRILQTYPDGFRQRALALLRGRGVEVSTDTAVESAESGRLLTHGGTEVPFDALLWATGPAAPSLFRRSALATDDAGYLRVGSDLRTPDHPEIFAAGDCAALREHPWVPKAGVYSVREGPVLADNLRRAVEGRPLRTYAPQRHWLSLMNTGDGRALASYRGRSMHGRAAWWLKDLIDRRFMARFRRVGDSASEPRGALRHD